MNRETSTSGATQGTRFNQRELDVIRKAADLRGWSLAQLLRVGAVEKAVHILNAAHPCASQVRRLLSEVARQLLMPQINQQFYAGDYDRGSSEVPHLILDRGGTMDDYFPDIALEDCADRMEVYANSLHPDKIERFVTAIARLGVELAPMLSQEVAALSEDGFNVLMDPATVAITESPEPSLAEGKSAARSTGIEVPSTESAPKSASRKAKAKTKKPNEGGVA